ncbi:MAG: response regulator transcription factor [Candidatus Aminicenantes bacterium]|nr:response regulator transcription factor [Candidatus Aminicenantes bacterium]
MTKILVIEDDKTLCETLLIALESENFEVLTVSDGLSGFRTACKENFDLIVLDLILPAMNGFEVCKKFREKGFTTPIIFLTGEKKEEIDKVLGLELGGDDYLLKPFGTRELIARIRAVLRRSSPVKEELEECTFGDVRINFRKQIAVKGENTISLTAKEFALLKFLVAHEEEVLTREAILNEVWGYETYPTTRTVDTFIHNLRHKIEDDPSRPNHIITVPWSGYKFKRSLKL